VHLGDVIVEGEDIYGEGVNIAARLEALSQAGSIRAAGKKVAGESSSPSVRS
jgi:class 3 adenylate cyclase